MINEDDKIELLPVLFEQIQLQNEAVKRTEEEILEIIKAQEAEESSRDTMGFSLDEFEKILKLNILDECRKLKIIPPNWGKEETEEDKLRILKKQRFAVWFFWDGLNTISVERGLIVNIYIHTSAKDMIGNKDIWNMLRDVLVKCHKREGGLIESTELELRSKMMQWRMVPDIYRMKRQIIEIGDREEEFDLVPDYRIRAKETETYQVTLTDTVSGITATGRGNIKFRNQVDWGTKLELSRKVREWEFLNRREQNDDNQ